MSLIDPVTDVAGMFYQGKDEPDAGVPRTISVRLTESRLAMVDAMADYAEVSRNVMANQLIRAGISSVLAQLPTGMRDEILGDVHDRLEE